MPHRERSVAESSEGPTASKSDRTGRNPGMTRLVRRSSHGVWRYCFFLFCSNIPVNACVNVLALRRNNPRNSNWEERKLEPLSKLKVCRAPWRGMISLTSKFAIIGASINRSYCTGFWGTSEVTWKYYDVLISWISNGKGPRQSTATRSKALFTGVGRIGVVCCCYLRNVDSCCTWSERAVEGGQMSLECQRVFQNLLSFCFVM